MGFGFLSVYVGLWRDVMELWWEMEGSYPVVCGLFLWESRLAPTFVVWVSLDGVFIVGTLLFGTFLSLLFVASALLNILFGGFYFRWCWLDSYNV